MHSLLIKNSTFLTETQSLPVFCNSHLEEIAKLPSLLTVQCVPTTTNKPWAPYGSDTEPRVLRISQK
mgnify:CR=1 FL=1